MRGWRRHLRQIGYLSGTCGTARYSWAVAAGCRRRSKRRLRWALPCVRASGFRRDGRSVPGSGVSGKAGATTATAGPTAPIGMVPGPCCGRAQVAGRQWYGQLSADIRWFDPQPLLSQRGEMQSCGGYPDGLVSSTVEMSHPEGQGVNDDRDRKGTNAPRAGAVQGFGDAATQIVARCEHSAHSEGDRPHDHLR